MSTACKKHWGVIFHAFSFITVYNKEKTVFLAETSRSYNSEGAGGLYNAAEQKSLILIPKIDSENIPV